MCPNVIIGLGELVIAGAGGMARAGATAWLYPAEMVGIVLMFAALRASTFLLPMATGAIVLLPVSTTQKWL